jgi:3-oxoacyl-[acyl-carrier protein] reductase
LSGRTKSSVEAVAKKIAADGGTAQAVVIDTLDDAAVNQYIDGIVKHAGKLDIVLDTVGLLAKEYGNGKSAVDLPIEEFMVPLATMVKSRFITARAAARAGSDCHRRGSSWCYTRTVPPSTTTVCPVPNPSCIKNR